MNPRHSWIFIFVLIPNIIWLIYLNGIKQAEGGLRFVILAVLSVLSLMVLNIKIYDGRIRSNFNLLLPSRLYLIITTFFLILGYYNQWIILKYFPLAPSNLVRAIFLTNLSAFLVTIGILFSPIINLLHIGKKREVKLIFDYKKYFNTFLIFLGGMILVISAFYFSGGYIEIFRNIGVVRQNVWRELSAIAQPYFFGSQLMIIISGTYLVKYRNNKLVLMSFIIFIFLMFGSLARYFFIMPLVVVLMNYNFMVKRIHIKQLTILFLIITLISVFYVPFKTGDFEKEYENIFENLGYYMMTEFTSLSRVMYFYPQGNRGGWYILKNFIYPTLPRHIWGLLWLEKKFAKTGLIFADIQGITSGAGIRIGLAGEMYHELGLKGAILVMLIFGIILGTIDRSLISRAKDDAVIFLLTFASVIMCFGVIQHLGHLSQSFFYPFYLMVIFMLLSSKRVKYRT